LPRYVRGRALWRHRDNEDCFLSALHRHQDQLPVGPEGIIGATEGTGGVGGGGGALLGRATRIIRLLAAGVSASFLGDAFVHPSKAPRVLVDGPVNRRWRPYFLRKNRHFRARSRPRSVADPGSRARSGLCRRRLRTVASRLRARGTPDRQPGASE
jgi:hypothetical protein